MAKRLSEVRLQEDEVLLEGFEATIDGTPVTVTAVLERTCVYETPDGVRRLANKRLLMVEPEKLPIKRRRVG
ncbi:MAG TPA: hypothetical protein VFD01_09955 [Candidatus Dormibacteraeota bacterium]|jgi:hypothetical protein|nr:hypothetical protein [Candidatus Dormibacteraeota bacterium]